MQCVLIRKTSTSVDCYMHYICHIQMCLSLEILRHRLIVIFSLSSTDVHLSVCKTKAHCNIQSDWCRHQVSTSHVMDGVVPNCCYCCNYCQTLLGWDGAVAHSKDCVTTLQGSTAHSINDGPLIGLFGCQHLQVLHCHPLIIYAVRKTRPESEYSDCRCYYCRRDDHQPLEFTRCLSLSHPTPNSITNHQRNLFLLMECHRVQRRNTTKPRRRMLGLTNVIPNPIVLSADSGNTHQKKCPWHIPAPNWQCPPLQRCPCVSTARPKKIIPATRWYDSWSPKRLSTCQKAQTMALQLWGALSRARICRHNDTSINCCGGREFLG